MNDATTTTEARRTLVIEPVAASDPTIASCLGALEDSRARTLTLLADTDPGAIDWVRDDENTIGTLLYHVAAIEADWLYAEVLEQPFPPDIIDLFPYDVRETDGRLTPVGGRSLDQHIALLKSVRSRLLTAFQPMSLGDFRRARQLPDYDVTPEWVVHHLMQHEAEHRGQIGLLRTAAEHAVN